jgi:hypothetical protein
LALKAEQAFKPERGSFATYLGYRLKELHRLHHEEKDTTSSEVQYSKGELGQDKAEERGEEVELEFSGGNGPRLTFDFQWWLPRLVIANYISSLGPFRNDESEVRTFKTMPWGRPETNYSRSHTTAIPTLESRHRIAVGVQLGGSDNAPAVQERISENLPELLRQQPVGDTLKGWTRAFIDHLIRRQREADDEAQKRLVGDHSPTFLETEPHSVDLRFPGARRPPKYLRLRLPMASMDAPIRTEESGDGAVDEANSLHEIIGGDKAEPGVDQQAETTRWALKELRLSLRKNELPIADRMLDILDDHRSHSLTELATDLGHSKGQISKLWGRVAGKVADKIRSRK